MSALPRKALVSLGLAVLVLGIAMSFMAWAAVRTNSIEGGWAELAPVWGWVVAGALAVGGAAAGFMWLAFHSRRHGYDDRADGR